MRSPRSVLSDLRRDLEDVLDRVSRALDDMDRDSPRDRYPDRDRGYDRPRTQTYPVGYDFRRNRAGLQKALDDLDDRIQLVGADPSITQSELYDEMKLRTAEIRLLQTQTEDDSSEWKTAGDIIRTLTAIVRDKRPGFVFGLSTQHQADWGQKIEEIKQFYTPVELGEPEDPDRED